MKKTSLIQIPLSRGMAKILILMKTSALLLLLGTLTVSASVLSQKVTLEMKNAPLRQVLDEMEKQAGFKFFYLSEQIDDTRKVDIEVKEEKINTIIDYLFAENPVKYKVFEDNLIVLSPDFKLQDNQVTGKVTEAATGDPMPGVNVLEKGTTNGTITDMDGKYSLTITTPEASLVFSFVGYLTEEVKVAGRKNIDMNLVEDIQALDEVLVIGYSTIKKRDITGSISSVAGEDLATSGYSDVGQALQGRSAGVYVVSSSGKPGSSVSVRIRGIGGINDSEPLYVIDGIQGGDISLLNPSDIESIEILKDASSSAIYGARGANGVVLVTTKRGEAGKLNVEYNGSYGIQNVINVGSIEFLNGRQFAENFNSAFINDGLTPPFGGTNTAAYPSEFFPDPSQIGEGTNWWNVMTQPNAAVQEHTLSMSGGNEKQRMYTSLSYYNQDGVIINSGYDKYTFRINSSHIVTDWLELGTNTSLSRVNITGNTGENKYSDIWYAMIFNPLIPVYDDDGNFGAPLHPQMGKDRNPFASSENLDRKTTNSRIDNNFYGSIKVLKDLTFRSNLATVYTSNIFDHYYNGLFREGIVSGVNTQLWYSQSNSLGYQWSNLLKYSKILGKHNVSALTGYELQAFRSSSMGGAAQYYDPKIKVINTQIANNTNASQTEISGSMISYFANLTYNFNNKYYLTANLRRDGSSKFGANNLFGVFPSISGAWRISEENFFNLDFVNDFKIRASYGEVGNDKIGYFSYLAPMQTVRYPINGQDGGATSGLAYNTLANPDLKWEFTMQKNIGIDLALLNNKVYLSADYFITEVEDMLLGIKIPVSSGAFTNSYTQFEYPSMITNIGSLSNKGLEIELKFNDNIGDVFYSIGANLTTYNNEVLDIGENEYLTGTYSRTYVGGSLGDFYGYVNDGIFQTLEEVEAANAIDGDPTTAYQFDGTTAGDFKYKDLNGDGKVNTEDRTIIGSPIPDFTYGINFKINYKNLTLTSLFSGSYGNDIYNAMRKQLEYAGAQTINNSTRVLDAWTGPGTSNTIPRRSSLNANNIGGAESIYLEDGSYFRLRTLQLSYTLPKNVSNKVLMQNARFYLAGDNLFTLTKYTGFDPEVNILNNLNAGVDEAFYPHTKILRMGVSITF